ncbi:FAD-dependent oxidoreductase [Gudongella sp. SC589]|jgi:alkyl hydroperoxide reductase subunit F|uniref:FAD-dependent oxidoreductase n=1 Tax=Gudongella sp. SC589 TaxID=3385990 RepID=UPI003904D0EB
MEVNLNLGSNPGKEKPKMDPETVYDLIVVGGGPAGLNAALYAKRKGLQVGIIARDIGGQVMDTSSVENYLGFNSLSGEELMKKFIGHVNELSVPILEYEELEAINVKDKSSMREVVLKNGEKFNTYSVIIATGSKPRKLGVPGEKEYAGKGVCYCAICDGPLFAGEEVIVAGGGNSAVEAAIDLAKIVKKVTIVHRSQFRADQILIDQLSKLDNVEVKLQTQILEVQGDKFMTGVKVKDKESGEEYQVEGAGLFVEIGYLPNSEIFSNLLELNERNEIVVDRYGKTSVEGIYAAGDVTDTPYKQIIMSAGDGAKCALAVNDYLNTVNK